MSDRPGLLERLFSLAGKAVLVTGAAGGIGRELAAGMAGAGARVALHDLDMDRLAEPLQRIRAAAVGGSRSPLRSTIRGRAPTSSRRCTRRSGDSMC